jgi:glyoxylase I family protein
MAVLRVGHIGVCVSDLERSLRFYCDLLGFRRLTKVTVDDPLSARLLRLPEVDQDTAFVERDGVRLALFAFRKPKTLGDGEPREMNRTGMAALMLRVANLDGMLEQMRSAGVRVLDDTYIEHPAWGSKLGFVCDPDGMLVELIEIPGDPYTPFGAPL